MSENKLADEELRKAIDYWREEALIAEEQGNEELARECLERAEALERLPAAPTSPVRRPR